jgi:hypothetical protein
MAPMMMAPDSRMESDLEAVARAYREARETAAMDFPARLAADAVYFRLHPDTPNTIKTRRIVDWLIKEACDLGMLWPNSQARKMIRSDPKLRGRPV